MMPEFTALDNFINAVKRSLSSDASIAFGLAEHFHGYNIRVYWPSSNRIVYFPVSTYDLQINKDKAFGILAQAIQKEDDIENSPLMKALR